MAEGGGEDVVVPDEGGQEEGERGAARDGIGDTGRQRSAKKVRKLQRVHCTSSDPCIYDVAYTTSSHTCIGPTSNDDIIHFLAFSFCV